MVPGTLATCTGLLGSGTLIRDSIEWQIVGRLLGRIIMNPPVAKRLELELLPWVTTAELLQDVPPLIRSAAYVTTLLFLN